MSDNDISIFQRYYSEELFIDRFLAEPEAAVDVIIPVIHSNELWKANLRSFYREIPIHRLLIGDGGCIDDTIEIVSKFPRVTILDHRNIQTIGYSERKLIEAVETEWFIHLHSDVFLPERWFDTMKKYQTQYDYFGCVEQDTILVESENDYGERPWAGAQFVRKQSLEAGLLNVDDDYIYRQGDYVYRRMIEEGGFKEGRVRDTFHYHQIMYRRSPWQRKIKSIEFKIEMTYEEEVRTYMTFAKGIVKYLKPPIMASSVIESVNSLQAYGELTWEDFDRWVQATNPSWLPYLHQHTVSKRVYFQARVRKLIQSIIKKMKRLLK
jgi:hypothetical protein